MNCKKKFTLLLSASALSIALMLPGADTSYAASGNDFNVNTGWTMTDNIATKYTVKNGAGAFSTGNSKIGDIGVTATFVKQADRNDGASYLSDNGNNQAAYGATAGMFYGNPDPGSIPALGMNTQPSNGCGGPLGSWEKYNADGEYEVGSVTFKFDKKVTDPILDLSGLGGYVSRVGSYLSNGQMILVGLGSFNSTNLHLATEGITLENVASNSNLTADNNIIQVKDRNTHTRAVVDNGGYNWIQFQDGYGNQYNVNSPSLVPAGTGSVRLKGTFDKVTFKLYHQATPYSKFSQAKYKTHSSYFANQIGGDPANGDGINGMNVINTESVHIGGQWFNGDQNWDLFRASLRLPKPSSIGDKVWLDGNKDGIQDSTEKPASGVTVKLLDKDGNPVKDFNGNPVKDQVTDENGNYKFENLAAGDYIVEIVPKDGQKLTIKGAGTNATADSDFDSETNKSDSITLEPNQEKTDIDAGLVEEDTYKVVYKFEPSDDGVTPKELPEEVKKQLPAPVENKENGDKVDSPERTTFKNVETDEGTWSFERWEKDSVTIDKDTIGEDRTEEVIGYWKFTPKPKEYKVDYEFQPSKEAGTPSELPQGVKDQLPEKVENLEDGKSVPSPKEFTPVKDEVNKGTWTFEKWDKETAKIDGKDEHVTGTWKFTKDEEPQPKEYKVDYEFQPSKAEGTPDKLPEEVLKQLPEAKEKLADGKEVPSPKDFKAVKDEANKGTWKFEAWDKETATIKGADEHVVGTWVFTPDAEVVTEYVDEDGNTISDKETGTKDKKDIKGYEFVKTEKDEKGNTKHIYKKVKPTPEVVTEYVDEDGNTISDKETGTKDKKDIEGYEFVETKTDEKGNTKHIYKKKTTPSPSIVTKFVDEDGNPIAKDEDGNKDKKDIPGYEFVKTINDKDGNVVHVYRFKQTPSPTVETRYFDTEGNQILADKSGTHDPSTIEGYQFVRTEKDEKGNTVHIYQKLAPVPEVETRYVDENGNQLLPPKEGEQGSVAIDGYNYIRTSKDNNGNTIHTYSKTPFEDVETRYVDTEGNQILADKAGENPASTIEGYQFVRTEKDDKGNITHIYQKTAPTVKVETRYIDENGNQLLPPKEGTQNQVNIEGYVYISTNNDNNGNTIHIYKKVIKPIEDVVTKFVDENGNEIAQTQKGKNPSQNIEGYEIITTKTDDKGNIIYVYRKKPDSTKVVTKFVDEKGNTIAESEDGKKPNKDIKGYEFVKTETDKDGNTVHIYKKKTTPPTEVVTEYVDENGKTIAPKENGTKDKKDIKGYEFVKTEKDEKGNTKHIYKKKENTTKVVTKFVDEKGNTIAESEEGKKPNKDIKDYEFVKTETDKDGNTIHIYKKKSSSTENKYKVTHKFESTTPGKTLPKEVLDLLPKDLDGMENGSKVTPTKPSKLEVKVKDGTWVFEGYDKNSSTIDNKDVNFTGKWKFVPNKIGNVRVSTGTNSVDKSNVKTGKPNANTGKLNVNTGVEGYSNIVFVLIGSLFALYKIKKNK